ncbi:MAG: LysR family transcriptional regulator [Pseudomonadota bacterium]
MHEAADSDYIFIRVVEAGSLRAVAQELGVDPSSISRRISALEDRLKAKLLRRSTKRSEPTEAGLRYYNGMRRLLDERAALEDQVSGLTDEPRGRLRVGAPVDFGARFVAPVVAELITEFPDLDVELVLGSGFDDLVETGLDAVIRIGNLTDSSLIAKKVGSVPRMVVASRQYLAEHGKPKKPADLAVHPFVFYQNGQRRGELVFSKAGKRVGVEITGRTSANSVSAIRELVIGGAGLHFGPVWAFEEELANGTLVPIVPDWACVSFPIQVLWVPTEFLPVKVRLFAERFASFVGQQGSLEPLHT